MLHRLAERIVHLAMRHACTISAAESCTGGLLSASLTDISGASNVFCGSIVSYTEEIKARVLGICPDIFHNNGVYSNDCAQAMAEGARALFATDVALGITGIAGPGGALFQKPVGSVWIGLATPKSTVSKAFHFTGTREEVRDQAVKAAFQMLLEALEKFSA